VRSISGVSCESCHGAAISWIDEHADFGPDCENAREESPEHRLERLAHVDSEGMLRPESLYALATRCFDCHAITDAELLEVGGHPAGDGFELVAWSQGEMRHNFIREDGSVSANTMASSARQASMYVLGRGLQLDFALRALEMAGNDAARARVERALHELREIARRVQHPFIEALLVRMKDVDLLAELPESLIDEIKALVRSLDDVEGLSFAGLEDLLPAPEEFRGEPSR